MPFMMLMGSSGTWASSSLRRSRFRVPQHGFTFTLRGRGWSALTTRPPGSSRCRRLPVSLTFEVLPRLVRLQVGETLGLPPRVLHLIFKDALRCLRLVEVVHTAFVSAEAVPSVACASREHPLMGFSKTIPPSTCAPGVHSHPSSRQAVFLGFGQGLPAPRLVPSVPFLTTSTGFSSWCARMLGSRRSFVALQTHPIRCLGAPRGHCSVSRPCPDSLVCSGALA